MKVLVQKNTTLYESPMSTRQELGSTFFFLYQKNEAQSTQAHGLLLMCREFFWPSPVFGEKASAKQKTLAGESPAH